MPIGQRASAIACPWLLAAIALNWYVASAVVAVTPDSPEVRKLISAGFRFLETETDRQLGGKCLIALAFHKDGAASDHPRIVEAIEACKNTIRQGIKNDYIYSEALAIIFLAELNPEKYRDLISHFAGLMKNRQKQHGGWGYESRATGDTSQTQYAALCYWELWRSGRSLDVDSVVRCTNWLLRTQDPSGAWGYQGNDPGEMKRVVQTETTLSMLAAGLGSTMIFGNILGILKPGQGLLEQQAVPKEKLPPALKLANLKSKRTIPPLRSSKVDAERLQESVALAQQQMDKNFQPQSGNYTGYYLYSVERYKSFEELISGNAPEEPDWYQQGFKQLASTQQENGSWVTRSGAPCGTAFSLLFLMRSTQQSIRASLGEGTLVGGRGLSADLSRMKMQRGKLVVDQKATEIDQLLTLLEGPDNDQLDSLLEDSTMLQVEESGVDGARRLQQIVRSGSPEARLLAVRGLSRFRNLDYVPSLLYAMTDPDQRVVRAARDGLRFVSRRFGGFGLKDNFSDRERYDALDRWKKWYRTIRPDAL